MGGHFDVPRGVLVGRGRRLMNMNAPRSPVDAFNPERNPRSTDHSGSLPYRQTVRWGNGQLGSRESAWAYFSLKAGGVALNLAEDSTVFLVD